MVGHLKIHLRRQVTVDPLGISLHVSIFPILRAVLDIHFMVYSCHKSRTLQTSVMFNDTQEAIFLNTGGWNSYNIRQAAPEDAQKSKNLLYRDVTAKRIYKF